MSPSFPNWDGVPAEFRYMTVNQHGYAIAHSEVPRLVAPYQQAGPRPDGKPVTPLPGNWTSRGKTFNIGLTGLQADDNMHTRVFYRSEADRYAPQSPEVTVRVPDAVAPAMVVNPMSGVPKDERPGFAPERQAVVTEFPAEPVAKEVTLPDISGRSTSIVPEPKPVEVVKTADTTSVEELKAFFDAVSLPPLAELRKAHVTLTAALDLLESLPDIKSERGREVVLRGAKAAIVDIRKYMGEKTA